MFPDGTPYAGNVYLRAHPLDESGEPREVIIRSMLRTMRAVEADDAQRRARFTGYDKRMTGRFVVLMSPRLVALFFRTGGLPELPDGWHYVEKPPLTIGARVNPPGTPMDLEMYAENDRGRCGHGRFGLLPDRAFLTEAGALV